MDFTQNEYINEKINSKNYFALVCDILKYIEKNKIPVGAKLPDEVNLAAELCASRPTLREALKVLEVFGIIDSKRGSGNVYVNELNVGISNLALFYNLVNGPKGDVDFISLRAVIEANAVESFIEKATEREMIELKDIYLTGLLYKDNLSNYIREHTRFHLYLMKYYENEVAKDFVASNIRMVGVSPYKTISYENDEENRKVERILLEMRDYDHDNILKAVLARNVSMAKSILISHIMIPSKKYLC